jgi:anti-anti-sigma factor
MPRPSDLAWFLAIEQAESASGEIVLSVSGRLGKAAAGGLPEAVRATIGSGKLLIVMDLSALDYVNSAGLLALGQAAALVHAAGGSLTVIGLQDPVKLALDLGGPIPHLTMASGQPG